LGAAKHELRKRKIKINKEVKEQRNILLLVCLHNTSLVIAKAVIKKRMDLQYSLMRH